MNIKYVFWDWNGTLIDDACLCVSILNKLLFQEKKDPIDLDYYRCNFSFPVSNFYKLLSLPNRGSDFDVVSNYFISNYRQFWHECSLQPNCEFVLDNLHKSGVKQYILSAGMQKDVEGFINYHKLNWFFSRICGTKDIYADGKLSSGLQLMKSLKVNPSEILLVGDTLHDHEVGSYIGCQTLLFTGGHNAKTVLERSKCGMIDDLSEVLDFVLH